MRFGKGLWKDEWKKKYVDPDDLESTLEHLRRNNKTIATLNGSFDLLHAGHLHIIFEASKVADILFVLLNSDASVQSYKDPKRPIINLDNRLQMVAALEFVDYVSYFDELDPRAILDRIRPDVHVNGAEYGKECIEAETVQKYGGKLVLVDRIPGLATSQIITKIFQSCESSLPPKM